jgi:poly(3-hydroxybutyrate) depolymerase
VSFCYKFEGRKSHSHQANQSWKGVEHEKQKSTFTDTREWSMKNRKVLLLILVLSLAALAACLALFFGSSGCGSDSGFTTGERTVTSQDVERVYYLKLPGNYNATTPYPLIFAFHGLGGDYTAYSEGYYDLQELVGDEAILVYPNALPNKNDVPQWNYERDLVFFDDLYQELESNLCFDLRKVFAVGHSAGAGMSHTLGCQRGSVLRAIAPVSGSLADRSSCIGQVAVIQTHGSNDDITPIGTSKQARDYWIAINSCTKEDTSEGVDPTCSAFGECDTNFPVQYCEHEGGHEWPDFASDAMWTFFQSLPPAVPSDKPGTGDVDALAKGSISFKIHYPSDFVGTPDKLAVTLYPPDTVQPIYTAPSYFLNTNVPLGDVVFGEVVEYNDIETNMLGVDNGDYTLQVMVWPEGSNYPMPTKNQDYIGLQNITVDSKTIIVAEPFDLEFTQTF